MSLNVSKIQNYARSLAETFSVEVLSDLLREVRRSGYLEQDYYAYGDVLNFVTNKLADKVSLDIAFYKPNDVKFNFYIPTTEDNSQTTSVMEIQYNWNDKIYRTARAFSIWLGKTSLKDTLYYVNLRGWIHNGSRVVSYKYNGQQPYFCVKDSQELFKILGYFCSPELHKMEVPPEEHHNFFIPKFDFSSIVGSDEEGYVEARSYTATVGKIVTPRKKRQQRDQEVLVMTNSIFPDAKK
jgi:hypothetical protein